MQPIKNRSSRKSFRARCFVPAAGAAGQLRPSGIVINPKSQKFRARNKIAKKFRARNKIIKKIRARNAKIEKISQNSRIFLQTAGGLLPCYQVTVFFRGLYFFIRAHARTRV